MMTTAEAITNGHFPFGAMMISEKVAAAFEANRDSLGAIGHGYTCSGHPVGAAAALAALKKTARLDTAADAALRGLDLMAARGLSR